MQAGNELIGREMACFCLRAAAQCFEVCWGSLIHLLSSLGEVWQAMSLPSCLSLLEQYRNYGSPGL